jgi:hypothetical protein
LLPFFFLFPLPPPHFVGGGALGLASLETGGHVGNKIATFSVARIIK